MLFEKIINIFDLYHQKRIINYLKKLNLKYFIDVGAHKGEFLSYILSLNYKKIIFDKKTTKLSDIELTNLRKKYYLKLNTQKELINTNNRLKEISKQNNIKFINSELFFCNHEKKECLVRLDDFNEIYRDYGRHSMPGLKLMGSMISKDFF